MIWELHNSKSQQTKTHLACAYSVYQLLLLGMHVSVYVYFYICTMYMIQTPAARCICGTEKFNMRRSDDT